MQDVRRILVATDLSDPSKLAIDAGIDLAGRFGAKVILGYVLEDRLPPIGAIEFSGIDLVAIEQQHAERAKDSLERIARQFRDAGIDVEIEVVAGIPHNELIRMAERSEADLIVMGTHGRGFVAHALLGSTTERVLRNAPCPVFAVRDRRKAAAA